MKNKAVKRVISVILSALMLVLCMSSAAAVAGDFDGNGKVDSSDARSILRTSVGLEKVKSGHFYDCDFDLDRKITAADARLALRKAVGLSIDASDNEYDLLYTDKYYADFNVISGSQSANQIFASTANTFYLPFGEGGIYMELMCINGALYYVNSKEMLAVPFTKETFTKLSQALSDISGEAGLDFDMGEMDSLFDFTPEDIASVSSELFPKFGALSEADSVTTEKVGTANCKVYVFKDSGITGKVYMDGRKLVRMSIINAQGVEIETYNFNFVSSSVPSQYSSLTDYTMCKTGDEILEFFFLMMA